MIYPDILNDGKYQHLKKLMNEAKIQFYLATEIGYIQMYLKKDGRVKPGIDFSEFNLKVYQNEIDKLNMKGGE